MKNENERKTDEELIDEQRKLDRILRDNALYIKDLSNSFAMTGNSELAENLKSVYIDLMYVSDTTRRNRMEELNNRLDQTKEDVGKVFSAVVDFTLRGK